MDFSLTPQLPSRHRDVATAVAAQREAAMSQRNLQWWIFHAHEESTPVRQPAPAAAARSV